MADNKYEIYFFGLLAFVFEGRKRVEIVSAGDHCPLLYGPGIDGTSARITGNVAVSLTGTTPTPDQPYFHYVPHLRDHVLPKNPGNAVGKKSTSNPIFELPDGHLSVADFYSFKGEFDDGTIQPIPRVTILRRTSSATNVTVSVGGKPVGSIKPDSFLLIANAGSKHDCKKDSHFMHFLDITDGDKIHGLCDSDKKNTVAPDTAVNPANLNDVLTYLEKGKFPCKDQSMEIFNQVDCSSSQWP